MVNSFIEKANADELIKKLSKQGIVLNKMILIKQYANYFNLNQILESLKEIHSDKLKTLDKQNKSVNSKYLEYILDKVIRENYDVEELIDPYYLFKDIQKENKSIDEIKSIINRLLRLNELHHLNNTESYFDILHKECNTYIFRMFEEYQIKTIDDEERNEFINLTQHFIDSYDQNKELNARIALLQIECIASKGNTIEIDQKIQEIKKTYALSIFEIYTYVLLGSLDLPTLELFKKYYQKAKQYMVLNEDHQREREFIDVLYHDVMMDEE